LPQSFFESPFPIKPLNPVNFILAANAIWLYGLLFLHWSLQEVMVVFSIEIILFLIINFIKIIVAGDNLPWFDMDTLSLKLWVASIYIVCCGGIGALLLTLGLTGADFDTLELKRSLAGLKDIYNKFGLVASFILFNTTINFFLTFFYNGKYKIANPFLIAYKTFITLIGMSLFMTLIIFPLVNLFEDEQFWMVIACGIVVLKTGVEIISYQLFYSRWPNFEVIELKKQNNES